MKYIWAIGLFAAGQSSTMTGTYTGQFVMSGFMELHVSPMMRALITRSVALVPTLAVAVAYAGTNEMDALNQGLNVLQSIQLPFALLPVLYISTREDVMGSIFVVRSHFRRAVQLICGALLVVNLYLVATTVLAISHTPLTLLGTIGFCTVYASFVAYLLIGPVAVNHWCAASPHRWAQLVSVFLGREVPPDELAADASGAIATASDRLPLVVESSGRSGSENDSFQEMHPDAA
jgi:natural resistance-associated macrophage protein 2